VKLTSGNLTWNGSGYTVTDDLGQPRVNADGSPLTPEAFYAEFATARPYLVKGQVKSGAGSTSSSGAPTFIDRYSVESLYGPSARPDAGKILNEMSLRNKPAYDALRKSAAAKNLVTR